MLKKNKNPRIPYLRNKTAQNLYTDEEKHPMGETSAGQLSGTKPRDTQLTGKRGDCVFALGYLDNLSLSYIYHSHLAQGAGCGGGGLPPAADVDPQS